MSEPMHVAKVLRSTGLIENLELAYPEWVDEENAKEHENIYIPFEYGDIKVNIGGTWDGVKFIPAKIQPSWLYDEETNSWKAPVEKPEDPSNGYYYWNEEALNWFLEVLPEPLVAPEEKTN
jgi:hypothetical protein